MDQSTRQETRKRKSRLTSQTRNLAHRKEATHTGLREADRNREKSASKNEYDTASWKRSNSRKLHALSTGRGGLRSWTWRRQRALSLTCRGCGGAEETAGHVVFECEKDRQAREDTKIHPHSGWRGLTEEQVEKLFCAVQQDCTLINGPDELQRLLNGRPFWIGWTIQNCSRTWTIEQGMGYLGEWAALAQPYRKRLSMYYYKWLFYSKLTCSLG